MSRTARLQKTNTNSCPFTKKGKGNNKT